ncbi:hypothetical protein SAMN05660299_02018 [Megasphaera paucivorans]|uniref:Uncharacterized protein n=1 Tax=Megasphaera paucivorans TaxID=349095 RepID=A0A1G9Y874_9FIRM|nr:hypothetical protein SAMN05660299_02018 [Megasphaera paucivorans]
MGSARQGYIEEQAFCIKEPIYLKLVNVVVYNEYVGRHKNEWYRTKEYQAGH